jgi:serine/threonine protein kinase
VVLWAPEFFGKTWLLRHLIHRVQRPSPRSQIVAINLDLFDKSLWRQPQGLDSFLRELALHMALALGEQPEAVYREWTTPSTTANLDRVMRRLILPHAAGDKGPLVLAIDRADAVLGSPLQNTFFGILRGWAESEEPWSVLRLVLAISTTPALLVSSQHQSPFNLTDTVELKDLREEQTQRLGQLYQLRWGHAELETLRRWVGGHPYLTRLAMYTAVRQGVSLAQLFDPDHPASRVFDGFLARITARLRSHPERFEALQRVLADPGEDLGEAELPLMRAGLLLRDAQGRHLPRYELYRRLASKVPSGGRLSRNLPVVPSASVGLLDTSRGPAPPAAGTAATPGAAANEPGGPVRIEVGQRLGPYKVVRQLGHGGMGAVYEVYNDQLKRRAAMKLLHAELSNDPEMAKRFLNEARAANVVQHPGIINFYEMGQLPGGETYFIMEYIDGEPLGDRLQRAGRLAVESTLRLCQQIAAALAAAHNTGVVHRDLKPDNLMLIRDPLVLGGERIKVLDFGLAKVAKRTFDDSVSTDRGVLMGTPLYMAPEQCRGAENVGAKADVYALGVILFELLAGRPPFAAREVGEVLAMHQRDEPPRLQSLAPSLPRSLYALVHSMLAKDPDARPTMSDVAGVLQQLEAKHSAEQSALQVDQGTLFRSWTLWLTLLGILLVALLPLSIQLVRSLLSGK